MAIEITMPKLSDTMTDGQFIIWHKQVGDRIERGDILAEVETDKAVMELEAFASGILIKTLAKAGETVPVGTVLGLIGEPEELAELTAAAAVPEAPPQEAATESARAGAQEKPQPAQSVTPHLADEHEKASPIVRRMAREQGVDLTRLEGSGPEGRITQDDLHRYLAVHQDQLEGTKKSVFHREEPGTGKPSAMRQAIATTVSRSWREIPHFNITVEVDMALCRQIVSELKAERYLVGYHALVIKACAAALERFPILHAADSARSSGISIGFAVALPDGLLIPVIRECQRLSVEEIGYEAARLSEKSRTGSLSADEMSGGGFTVSNLGMYGVDEFSALIVPGQTAILAVGAVAERALVRAGQLVAGPSMRVTLSCDHRAIDGAYAAAFLAELRRVLEHPLPLLLDQPIG